MKASAERRLLKLLKNVCHVNCHRHHLISIKNKNLWQVIYMQSLLGQSYNSEFVVEEITFFVFFWGGGDREAFKGIQLRSKVEVVSMTDFHFQERGGGGGGGGAGGTHFLDTVTEADSFPETNKIAGT